MKAEEVKLKKLEEELKKVFDVHLPMEKLGKKILEVKSTLMVLPKETKENLKPELIEAIQGIDHFFRELALKERNPKLYVENADSLIIEELKGKIAGFRKKLSEELKKPLREIEEKALEKIALEEELKKKKSKLESLNEELRKLVKMFATEKTAKGYPVVETEKVKIVLQKVPSYEVDPVEFLAIVEEKIRDPERKKMMLERCVRIVYSEAKKIKEIIKKLKKITKTKEGKPKVVAKIVKE
jgi:predicted RNase H-like nuclease (RuvC/YqgF family)